MTTLQERSQTCCPAERLDADRSPHDLSDEASECTLGEIFRRYGPAYRAKYGDSLPQEQRKVMLALEACRTGALGHAVYECDDCGKRHHWHASCGNRHCPLCQGQKARQWVRRQIERLLPCAYFLITFTVPPGLRRWIRSHPRIGYKAMFLAASAALAKLATDPRHVGATQIGLIGVLHTWGRQLTYHPHVHFLVPAGGLAKDRNRWSPSRVDFFVPVLALSKIYRAKLRDILDDEGVLHEIDPAVWTCNWVVNSQAVGDGRSSLRYLAPYVFRVAISNRRIVSCENGRVVFTYRKSGSKRWRKMEVSAFEFIRRFLQHVLPTGFMKVRYYGFLHAASGRTIEEIRDIIAAYYQGFLRELPQQQPELPDYQLTCPECGGSMHWVRVVRVKPSETRDTG